MSVNLLSERKRLAAVFSSLGILLFGTASLVRSMSIDYYTVLNTLQKTIPASFIIGCLGWVMGMVLDQPHKGHKINYNRAILDNYLNENGASVSENSETGNK